jgi:Rho-binding antiterminator
MINCDQHDYIEIVCMYRYEIKLTLKSGEEILGVARDTQRNDNKEECLAIDIEGDGTTQLVVLDSIQKLEVLEDNPHVHIVNFG